MRTKNKLRIYSLDEVKDKFIGKVGDSKRDGFEFELQMDILGEIIKTARLKNNLTQEKLGQRIGVKKAQISKLEKGSTNITIGTIKKVFSALNTKISFSVNL
ncbi:MAG TPA: helix-turn-helix transcriptional regulator [Ignavibacteria bacterium]|jgi:DNA-binding XRE family transcriptional regulator